MTKILPYFRKPWVLIFIAGIILFVITDVVMTSTSNPNFVPTVLLLGAGLIPVTFVAFIYQRVPIGEGLLLPIVFTFLWGGALGVAVAGFLEYSSLRQLGAYQLVGVGLIEEAAKLIIPLVFFFNGRFRHEADGLIFGIAAGMGFAALETMGYGFTTFLQSQGNPNSVLQTLLVRGILSPSGHAAWTGLVCAAIWRAREKNWSPLYTWAVAGTFVLAVALHSAWDILGTISSKIASLVFLEYAGLVVVGLVSFALLMRRFLVARHFSGEEASQAFRPS